MERDSRLRYARQIQLSEIGEPGQERISEANLQTHALDDTTLAYAKRFARAAGLATETPSVRTLAIDPQLASAFRHQASRAVGLGAEAALYSTLQALSPTLPPTPS